MEVSDPVTRVILPVRFGRKAVELPFESREECGALIAAVARIIPSFPDDDLADSDLAALLVELAAELDPSGELDDEGGVPFALAQPEPAKVFALDVPEYMPAVLAGIDRQEPEAADDRDTDDMGDEPTDYVPVQEPEMCQADGHGASCMRLEGHSGPHRSRGAHGDIEWVSGEKHPTMTMEVPGRDCPAMASDGNACTGRDGHPLPHRTAAGYEWGGGLDWDDPADTGEMNEPDDGPEPYGPADGPHCGDIAPDGARACGAQRGHGGDHGQYAPDGTLMHSWPQDSGVIPLRERAERSSGAIPAGAVIARLSPSAAEVYAAHAKGARS